MTTPAPQTVLFLCTGNYYRSRFAEILFNWLANRVNLPWQATSRGLALDSRNLGYMSDYTVNRLSHLQIPIHGYQRYPQDLTVADLNSANQIIAVKETEHRPLMISRFPEWTNQVEFWEVHDIDCARPEEALPQLELKVRGLLERLTAV